MNLVDVFDQCAGLAQIARKCPTPTLRYAYVKSMRDFLGQSRWLQVQIQGATVAGTPQYNLGSDPVVEIISIVGNMRGTQAAGGSSSYFPIVPADGEIFNPNVQSNRPSLFAYIPEGQFALWPTPDAAYPLLVTVCVQPKEGVTQVPSAPLVKYSGYIENGALAYLLGLPGQPWTNLVEARRQEELFRRGVGEAKTDVQRKFQSGSTRVKPRAFLRG
jgi:hypothetical protein